jgi:alkanesulfonate monooxygenase SsuD/methylene tetrahydromethanopterin reductase-like flavin-dependent oxidoreductase (luciferase family)
MKISVAVGTRPEVPAEEELRMAVLADRLGYAELWVGEGWAWDAFVLATALGVATERIPITAGPVPVHIRDPATIARAAATAAALVGRPVGVALGTSSRRVVEGMHGRSRSRPAATLAESAKAVRLRLDPQGGPLTVAAFGDRAIAVAAEHADRMVLDLVSPELAREYRGKLESISGRAGRPAPSLAAWIPAAVDPDPDSYAQIMRTLAGYLGVAGYAEMFTAAGFGDAVELARTGADPDELLRALPPEAAATIGLVGDARAVSERLEAYAEALDEVVLVPARAGDPGGERTLTALAVSVTREKR